MTEDASGCRSSDAEDWIFDPIESLQRRTVEIDRRERDVQVATVDVPRRGEDETRDGVDKLVQDRWPGQSLKFVVMLIRNSTALF